MKFNQKTLERDVLEKIHRVIQDADIVEGPDDLSPIVAELWPELLHKVKPPRWLMH